MSTPLRLAVIGAGNHSALHHGSALRLYAAAHPGAIELAAVCDLDAARARTYADKFGFARTYDDLRAMLARETLDGIIAITPVAATVDVAAELLPRGIPLVIEKPPGATAADARRLLAIAEKHKSPHMVSFNRRYIPAVVKAREWLAGPGKGRAPKVVIGRMLRSARREREFVTGTGIHLLDTILSFLGTPRRAFTIKVPTDHADRFLFDTVLDFGAGVSSAVVISPDVGTEDETVEIHGQGYSIQIDSGHCGLRISEGGHEVLSWQTPKDAEFAFSCGSLGETEAFVRSIREGGGYWPDLRSSLATMVTAEVIDAGGEGEIRVDA